MILQKYAKEVCEVLHNSESWWSRWIIIRGVKLPPVFARKV
jgi:hypothetical protein